MEALQLLLENFWILREQNKEDYYIIRDQEAHLKPFLEEKLGYKLIINPHMVKLEKVPGEAEYWMGIEDFKNPMDYVFLCLILAFLEEKSPEEQFVLSNITEYIQTTYPGDEKVDWTLFSHRKSLVRVLNFMTNTGIIQVNDGQQDRFSQDEKTEVLYENTGVSGYFLRSFGRELGASANTENLLNDEWPEGDLNKGNLRRFRVYRKLILSPVVYNQGVDDQDFLYIKNYRNTLQRDFEEYLDAKLHVHKNCAFLIYPHSSYLKSFFPDIRNISDIILQLSGILRDKINDGKITVNTDDTIELTQSDFYDLILEVRKEFKAGWYKSYRELSTDKLVEEVTETMMSWKMLEKDEKLRLFKILPIVGKFTGTYPDNFGKDA